MSRPFDRILVPFDGSVAALRACHEAAELAESFAAELVLLQVIEPSPYLWARDEDEADNIRSNVLDALEDRARKLRALGLTVRAMTAEGKPWEKIVEAEAELDVDLVIMGTHGRSGLDRALLGSVAERVVRTSTAPVLTVPEHVFADRADAAARLLRELVPLGIEAPIVIALSRGALPIASALARGLSGALDLYLVAPVVDQDRKALGAMGEDGSLSLKPGSDLSDAALLELEQATRCRLDLELACLRGGRPMRPIDHRPVIAVTDGLSAPAPARVAAKALRKLGPRELFLAVPIASRETLAVLEPHFERVVCTERPWLEDELAWYDRNDLPSEGKLRAQLEAGTNHGAHPL